MRKTMKKLMQGMAIAFAAMVILPVAGGVNANAQTPKAAATAIMKATQKCDDKALKPYMDANYKLAKKEMKSSQLKLPKYYESAYTSQFGFYKKNMPNAYGYIKKYNKKMTYSIKNVKTQGKKAYVTVQVKYAKSDKIVAKAQTYGEKHQEELLGILAKNNNLATLMAGGMQDVQDMDALTKLGNTLIADDDLWATTIPAVVKFSDDGYGVAAKQVKKVKMQSKKITIPLMKKGSKWVVSTDQVDQSLLEEVQDVMTANLFNSATDAMSKQYAGATTKMK